MQRNNSQFVTATISIAFAYKTVSIYPFIFFLNDKDKHCSQFGTLFSFPKHKLRISFSEEEVQMGPHFPYLSFHMYSLFVT